MIYYRPLPRHFLRSGNRIKLLGTRPKEYLLCRSKFMQIFQAIVLIHFGGLQCSKEYMKFSKPLTISCLAFHRDSIALIKPFYGNSNIFFYNYHSHTNFLFIHFLNIKLISWQLYNLCSIDFCCKLFSHFSNMLKFSTPVIEIWKVLLPEKVGFICKINMQKLSLQVIYYCLYYYFEVLLF